METGPQLKALSDRLVKPGIDPATPGLQGKWFIYYTTVASEFVLSRASDVGNPEFIALVNMPHHLQVKNQFSCTITFIIPFHSDGLPHTY